MPSDPRQFPRFPVSLRVRLKLPSGEVQAMTDNVSAHGVRLAVPLPIGVGDTLPIHIELRDGTSVAAEGECRFHDDTASGFALRLAPADEERWQRFVAEEEATGNLWHLLGRFASTSGDDKEAVRQQLERGPLGVLFSRVTLTKDRKRDDATVSPAATATAATTRLHVVGENAEAYRIAFERHGGVPPEKSDLAALPGFKALAVRAATRIMKNDVRIQRVSRSTLEDVRVVELARGGYAEVQGGRYGVPVGLVSLAVGELILIEENGSAVFPFFNDDDLERIACDTVRRDEKPRAKSAQAQPGEVERQLAASTADESTVSARPDLDTLRSAQDAAPRATRTYGDRRIDLFPHVWAQALLDDGSQIVGPTMRDGERLLLLVVEGAGAPRVARLDRTSLVFVMPSASR
jgi:hypothetical protein